MAKYLKIVKASRITFSLQLDVIREDLTEWKEEERVVCNSRDTTYNNGVLVQSIKLDEPVALQR